MNKTAFAIVGIICITALLIWFRYENQQTMRTANIDKCMEEGYKEYVYTWGNECYGLGYNDKKCALPMEHAKRLDNIANDRRKECLNKY